VGSLRSQNYRMSTAETLMQIRRQHRFVVLEMSGAKKNVLDLPIRLARPDIGVLTLIRREHYSAFRSLEAIGEEKGKLVLRLPKNGVAVLNIDDPQVRAVGERCQGRKIWIGKDKQATIRLLAAESVWPEPLILKIEVAGEKHTVITGLHGEHLALSVLSVLGIALALELPLDQVINHIQKLAPAEGRMDVVSHPDGVTFVRDDWKAAHWSMDAPYQFMANAEATRKVVVLGSISDSSLSPSQRYPRFVKAARKFAEIVIVVGSDALKALKARESENDQSVQAFLEIREAARFLDRTLRPGDLVLLKGANPQEHLVRLIHNRVKPISCWRDSCGRLEFCDYCPKLYEHLEGQSDKLMSSDVAAINTEHQWIPSPSGQILVVGLGNRGDHYFNTPHNLGYQMVERLATSFAGNWSEGYGGLVCQAEVAGKRLVLFKPETAINHSGQTVATALNQIDAGVSQVVLLYDELDLGLGKVKLSTTAGGSSHKGVLSVAKTLHGQNFARLRLGARPVSDKRDALQLALEQYPMSCQPDIERGLSKGEMMLREYIAQL